MRVQAQGGGLEASHVVVYNNPIPAAYVLGALELLQGQLTKKELKARADAFAQAEAWVLIVAAAGGVPAGTRKTFRNRGVKGSDARVDIEVLRGYLNIVP